jgi:hypothetical protein
MPQNTYWRTGRDAPSADGVALVVGVQDSALHIILDSPSRESPDDPPPRVTVTTDRGEPLRRQTATAFGTGKIGGRHLHIEVFDPPPPATEILTVMVTIGDGPARTIPALPVHIASEP